jgi:hypothetical protein
MFIEVLYSSSASSEARSTTSTWIRWKRLGVTAGGRATMAPSALSPPPSSTLPPGLPSAAGGARSISSVRRRRGYNARGGRPYLDGLRGVSEAVVPCSTTVAAPRRRASPSRGRGRLLLRCEMSHANLVARWVWWVGTDRGG